MRPTLAWDVATAFTTAAKLRSFRAAARELNKQPSAIAAAIQRIEDEVAGGQALFVRTATGAVLTDWGRQFLPLAEQLSAAITSFEIDAKSLRETRTTVRVGTIQGAWHQLLGRASELIELDIEIEPVALDPYWPVEPLLNGHIEWALLPVPSDHDAKLQRLPIFTEPRVVSAATTSHIGQKGKATLQEIDAETWIGAPPGADQTFVAHHRCDDLRPESRRPHVGRHILNPIDIGHAIRSGEVIIGSMHSITSMFAGLINGICDVTIANAPPWEVDLVTLETQRGPKQLTPRAFAKALRQAAADCSAEGITAIDVDS